MTSIAIKDLLEAGVHFGHQTRRWNPKMKPYIFGTRNGIYIVDLGKTATLFGEAEAFVRDLAANGKTVLFVGTKRQAQDIVVEEARRCGMFFVNQRWLGDLLTNFVTIQRSIARLRDLEAMAEDGRYDTFSKKEIARKEKEKRKLHKNLDGIRNMSRLPDAVFVVDTQKEKIAVDEALAGGTSRALRGTRLSACPQDRDGRVEVAIGFGQCRLAIHEPGPGLVSELLHLCGGNGHVQFSSA